MINCSSEEVTAEIADPSTSSGRLVTSRFTKVYGSCGSVSTNEYTNGLLEPRKCPEPSEKMFSHSVVELTITS